MGRVQPREHEVKIPVVGPVHAEVPAGDLVMYRMVIILMCMAAIAVFALCYHGLSIIRCMWLIDALPFEEQAEQILNHGEWRAICHNYADGFFNYYKTRYDRTFQ
jgi:hypothetical protein